MDQEIAWRDWIATLHRRRRVVTRVFVGGLAVVALGLLLLGPRYPVTATLMVTAERTRATVSPDENRAVAVDRVTDEELNSEVALLQSESLIREVVSLQPVVAKRRGLLGALRAVATAPLELFRMLHGVLHSVPAPNALDRRVEAVRRHLSVKPVEKSNLITLAYDERVVTHFESRPPKPGVAPA